MLLTDQLLDAIIGAVVEDAGIPQQRGASRGRSPPVGTQCAEAGLTTILTTTWAVSGGGQ
jgi:hypothetical protein